MKKSIAVAAAFAAASALALTGCSSPGAKAATAADSTLTIALASPPVSLDPSKAATGLYVNYVEPAYSSLLYRAPNGDIVGALADKWGYVGSDNKQFSISLRKGVKFADGTPITAQDVVASLQYFAKGSGGSANYFKGFTYSTPDSSTVVITSPTPDPVIADLLTPDYLGGAIISPAGLKDPTKLAANTFGAGPYVYSAAKSVSNDHYVFTPNKNYWNKGAIHYKSITIRVIPNVTSQVQALRSGQIDFMTGNADVASTVKSSSTIVTKVQPTIWAGLYLLDRSGILVPAMKDVRVRQALNYAVDRAAITKAVYGQYGQPVDQTAVSGSDAYDPSLQGTYPYDPAKAKQLLAAAGYSSGLTIPVNYGSFDPDNTKLVQAVQDQLSKVGVTLKLKADANFGGWVNSLVSKKYAATVLSPGAGGNGYFIASSTFMPGGIMNLYGAADPAMTSAFTELLSASPADQQAAAQKTNQVAVQDALALPISASDTIVLHNKKLQGVTFIKKSGATTDVTQWTSK